MRGAAVSPLGWQDFTARKCRRRNTTPREKTLNQTRAIVPTNFPQILELSQICFRIIRVFSRSPSFHILRFKRAAQLRPSHKGCGRENFLNFGFGFKNDQMLFCISGGKQRNTSVRFPNCHNASGLGNLNRKY